MPHHESHHEDAVPDSGHTTEVKDQVGEKYAELQQPLVPELGNIGVWVCHLVDKDAYAHGELDEENEHRFEEVFCLIVLRKLVLVSVLVDHCVESSREEVLVEMELSLLIRFI